ncbi:hypothetical protein VTL71DRAFT_9738 [Oculimacula yallundae]|uniref:Uncharacterized protein n=1 Tax=Oculimacula yallundae TaxID=86028 RepID=A0ABR4BRP0_9HELO
MSKELSADKLNANISNPESSPARTYISINSSPATPLHRHNLRSKNRRQTASSWNNIASPQTVSPVIETSLQRLRDDIAIIIKEKDQSIDTLLEQRDAERRSYLEAENNHLEERAELLQTTGLEIAKGTAQIWELRLQVKELGQEKKDLEETLQAASFQLKKDVLDLRASKTELEEQVQELEREKAEMNVELEGRLKAKKDELEQAKTKSIEDGEKLQAQDEVNNKLVKDVAELLCENHKLASEVACLEGGLRGLKRTWEDFKEGVTRVDERFCSEDPRSKKIAADNA